RGGGVLQTGEIGTASLTGREMVLELDALVIVERVERIRRKLLVQHLVFHCRSPSDGTARPARFSRSIAYSREGRRRFGAEPSRWARSGRRARWRTRP